VRRLDLPPAERGEPKYAPPAEGAGAEESARAKPKAQPKRRNTG